MTLRCNNREDLNAATRIERTAKTGNPGRYLGDRGPLELRGRSYPQNAQTLTVRKRKPNGVRTRRVT
jgi:hypothetical protein